MNVMDGHTVYCVLEYVTCCTAVGNMTQRWILTHTAHLIEVFMP